MHWIWFDDSTGARPRTAPTRYLSFHPTSTSPNPKPFPKNNPKQKKKVAPSLGLRRVASSLSFSHRTAFHCHIGAGKLGLGLVVPAILRAGTPFAIIQVRFQL